MDIVTKCFLICTPSHSHVINLHTGIKCFLPMLTIKFLQILHRHIKVFGVNRHLTLSEATMCKDNMKANNCVKCQALFDFLSFSDAKT